MSGGVIPALLAVAQEIQNPLKTADNPHFKSRFAPLDEMLTYVRPLLAKHRLVLVQTTEVGDFGPLLVTRIYHEDGTSVQGDYPLEPAKKDPQGYAAAMTYGRRYALMGVLGIAGDDDDGETASRAAAPGRAPKVDVMTGEVQRTKTKWTDAERTQQGTLRAEVIKYGGDEGDAEFTAVWKKLGYTSVQAALAQLEVVRNKWRAIYLSKGGVL